MAEELSIVERGPAVSLRSTLEPNTLEEALRFAEIVASSDLAPKDYKGKPANIVVAIQFGKELGIPPMQALQGVAVINGRPSVWGDLMWALVTNHPDFEDAIEKVTDKGAEVTLKRRKRTPVTVSFTQEDAAKAGLWNKQGPWTNYPKRQMLWRARTFAARDLFPDALKGMISAEEVNDYQTIDQVISDSDYIRADAAPAQNATITPVQAEEFTKAYTASGWKRSDARAKMTMLGGTKADGTPNITTSLEIPAILFPAVIEWANTPNPNAKKAESAKKEEAPKADPPKEHSAAAEKQGNQSTPNVELFSNASIAQKITDAAELLGMSNEVLEGMEKRFGKDSQTLLDELNNLLSAGE